MEEDQDEGLGVFEIVEFYHTAFCSLVHKLKVTEWHLLDWNLGGKILKDPYRPLKKLLTLKRILKDYMNQTIGLERD